MTQQTLRKDWYKTWSGGKEHMPEFMNIAADFFLARFKEFAEKELIGEDEEHHYLCGKGGDCNCGAKTRNALRNEQRKILATFLK